MSLENTPNTQKVALVTVDAKTRESVLQINETELLIKGIHIEKIEPTDKGSQAGVLQKITGYHDHPIGGREEVSIEFTINPVDDSVNVYQVLIDDAIVYAATKH